jgi:hypothetical protein
MAVVLSFAVDADAFDPFEIQIYDGTANEPGEVGLEGHLNHVLKGHRDAVPPLLPDDRQTHLTFEPSLGVTRSWEIGAYLQTSLRGDGTFDFAGWKARSKLVTPKTFDPHWRLGINLELGRLPAKFAEEPWGAEVRPIVAWEDDRWLLAVNPNVSFAPFGCGGPDGCTPSLEPGAAAYRKAGAVSLGFEYYGSLGPVSRLHRLTDQEHYLFAVANVLGASGWELNGGVGRGMTAASNDYVLKVIVGHALGRLF